MADDIFSKFIKPAPKAPAKPTAASTPPSDWRPQPGAPGRPAYEAYEPFENEVRTSSVELRCNRSGLSYFFEYAHIAVPVFNFRTGDEIYFTGGGYAVTIKGRNLRAIMVALRLHTCSTITDFDASSFVLPQPVDPQAPFVASISVEALTGPAPKKDDASGGSSTPGKEPEANPPK